MPNLPNNNIFEGCSDSESLRSIKNQCEMFFVSELPSHFSFILRDLTFMLPKTRIIELSNCFGITHRMCIEMAYDQKLTSQRFKYSCVKHIYLQVSKFI